MENLFLKLLPNYIFLAHPNGTTSKNDFLESIKLVYDIKTNEINKLFLEATEKYNFESLTRSYNSYKIN